jgi:penicillin-binding protein 1C
MKRRMIGIALCLVTLPVAAFSALVIALEVAAAWGELPGDLLAARPGSREVRDRRGEVLRETLSPTQDRARWVRLDEVSPHFLRALIAAEDARFPFHPGVDYAAIVRAVGQNLAGGRSGGSTLTQQVVKLVVGRPRSIAAKWRQAVLALRLERALGKREILEQYVNRASFGPREVGVEAAARAYFAKPAAQLSLGEAALLAALPKGPSHYDPRRHPERARARRSWVLARMEFLGMVTARDRAWAEKEPLALATAAPPFAAPHFTEAVLRQAAGDGSVTTTLDSRLQRRTEVLVRRTAAALRSRGGSQAAAVVLENATGEVLAYVGSADWRDEREGRNDGVRALRQPGSTLKPFAYALGFERDLTPAAMLLDLEAHFTTAGGEYSPRNFDGRFHGPVLAREALANSYNVPAVRVAHRLSPGDLLAHLRLAGFRSLAEEEDHYGLGLVLGNGEVTLLELAAAYAALARGGEWMEPVLLRDAARPRRARAFSPQAAFLVTHVLSDPRARRAAFGERSALDLPFPAAVKTGTSTDFRDNWTVGYTPEVTVAVWVGNFSGAPMRGVSGVTGAGPLWNELMQAAMEGRPHRAFPPPDGLETAHVCPRSGGLAGPHCGHRRVELFRAGTAPKHVCEVHGEVEVDVRTGLLAGRGCGRTVRRTVRGERWGADLAGWAASAGRPLLPARYSPRCPGPERPTQLRIRSPRDGEVLALVPDLPRRAQRVALDAVVEGAPARVRWLVDGREVARAPFPYGGRWTLEPGTHELVAEAGGIRSEPVTITVRE